MPTSVRRFDTALTSSASLMPCQGKKPIASHFVNPRLKSGPPTHTRGPWAERDRTAFGEDFCCERDRAGGGAPRARAPPAQWRRIGTPSLHHALTHTHALTHSAVTRIQAITPSSAMPRARSDLRHARSRSGSVPTANNGRVSEKCLRFGPCVAGIHGRTHLGLHVEVGAVVHEALSRVHVSIQRRVVQRGQAMRALSGQRGRADGWPCSTRTEE